MPLWRCSQNAGSRNDEKGATELLQETFPLLHVVYQAEVVRFLLKPMPGHEGFAKGVFGNVQHLVPYEAYAASRNRSTTNGCAEIALRHFAQKTLFRKSL